MMYRFHEWLERYRKYIILFLFFYLVWALTGAQNIQVLDEATIFGYRILSLLPVFIMLVAGYVIGFTPTGILAPSEKARRDLATQLRAEQGEIRLKIVAEHDPAKRDDLVRQLGELRKWQEALLNENLRREDGSFVTDWRESLLVTRRRLIDEEQRLLARNRANLSFGILMALVGVALPASYIVIVGELKPSDSFGTFVANYWPFFTIAVIIEIIAIFFLSLYASNERRLERNKNDLSNIELRLTAGLMLYDKTNGAKFAVLSDTLSKEESNVVLGKNESAGGIGIDRVTEILSKLIKGGS